MAQLASAGTDAVAAAAAAAVVPNPEIAAAEKELSDWYNRPGAEPDTDIDAAAVPVDPAIAAAVAVDGGVTPVVAEPNASAADAAAAATAATPAAPVAPPVDPAAIAAAREAYENEIVNDPDLSAELRGKSRREIFELTRHAPGEIKKSAMERNAAVREAEALRAAFDVIKADREAGRSAATAAPVAAPPAPIPGHQQFGFTAPEDTYAGIPQVVDQLPNFIETRVQQGIKAAVEPILAELNTMREKEAAALKEAETRQMYSAADTTFFAAGERNKVDRDVWLSVKPHLANVMLVYSQTHPDQPMLDPRYGPNWDWALKEYTRQSARLIPTVQNPATPAPPAGNRAPASVAAPNAARRVASTGSRETDTMLDGLFAQFGYTGNDRSEAMQRVIADMKRIKQFGEAEPN